MWVYADNCWGARILRWLLAEGRPAVIYVCAGNWEGTVGYVARCGDSLDNREIVPISSPSVVGSETPLASPLGSGLVGAIGLTPCSAYGEPFACVLGCYDSCLYGEVTLLFRFCNVFVM